jgi:GDP-D-mannose dehydratase
MMKGLTRYTLVDEIATMPSIIGDKAPSLKVGDMIVPINSCYFRFIEVEVLLGNTPEQKKNWARHLKLPLKICVRKWWHLIWTKQNSILYFEVMDLP